MRAGSDVALAAVWHPDPHHPITWAMFFGALIVVAGSVTLFLGVFAAIDTWRKAGRPRGRSLRGVLLGGGCCLVVGLVVAAFGIRMY
ncbi:hypothetical protein RM550_18440 [Streptomyces sp. DSM 41527]|uniref:DUF4190 domain-containing protein n=1 Tax=Streptomyces mooreae TaxID=3075523 RepID=A0ABU2T9V1_9ACTN|nr:hypothetical protein [Streptomyces sp. DSM 41527]MDT0457693.1 hypothetical protein [Streptomyces sp. DSM 41527]